MAWPWRRERPGVERIDRLIVQQYDAQRTLTIGGIDTCLRGVLEYSPPDVTIGVVGVLDDASGGGVLGRWQKVRKGERDIWFLPVARIDTTRPKGVVPFSVRLIAGLLRYRARIPRAESLQAHRVDVGLATCLLFRGPLVYCIHTQERGLLGPTSDSFWRKFGDLHERLDRWIVRRAERVIVFNPAYAEKVRRWNPRTAAAPTWFDPAITVPAPDPHPPALVWVGRLETPKNPELAIRTFAALAKSDPDEPWTFEVIGSGTLRPELEALIATLPSDVASRITLRGRLAAADVAEARSRSGVFLMTSHAGYEGFPRVLVEAMAAGLPAVVTEGADTGGLVQQGVSGFTCGRDPQELADAVRAARGLDRAKVTEAVSALSAPRVVRDNFFPDSADVPAVAGSDTVQETP
ncbi:MAG TPA: glycosyltransferase [Pseudonocardia sp.]|nr:glycosyltransferase [Pseudonocardia sp.]